MPNITHAISICGLCHLDPFRALGTSRPFSERCPSMFKNADEMAVMLGNMQQKKRERHRVLPMIF